MGRKHREQAERAKSAKRARNYALGGAGAVAILLAGAFLVLGAGDARAAPAWTATSIDGAPLGSRLFSGDVYVLDFFFLSCGICEKQLPDNKAMVEAFSARPDFHFVSITSDPADSVALIRDHQNDTGASWPHVRDTTGLYELFQVRGNPNLVFVDRDGNLALTLARLTPAAELIEQAQLVLDGGSPVARPTPVDEHDASGHP